MEQKYKTDRKSLERDTDVRFSRSPGRGGQNVNKRETKVQLHHLPSGIRTSSSTKRTQGRNLEVAFERLRQRLEELNKPHKLRTPTAVPERSKEKRLQDKQTVSKKKQQRKVSPSELAE